MLQQRMIYQIGDVVLHAHHKAPQTQQFQARGSSAELQDTYRTLTSTSEHKTSIRTDTAEVLLFSNGVFSPAHTVEILKSQIGVFQDIISYVYTTPEQAPEGLGCDCALCGCCPCQLLWLHNTGVLKSISVQLAEEDFYSATLTFELNSYWQPLNRLLWMTGSIGVSHPSVKRSFYDELNNENLFMDYPTCDSIEGVCMQFYKRNYNDLRFFYDPFWQVQMNCNLPIDHPEIGFARDWSSRDANPVIHIHKWLWSAPPLSIYSFRGIHRLSTKAQIRITRQEANREIIGRTTVNFERINNIAANAGITLVGTDILRVGDVEGFAHVIRDGKILLYVADAVNRTNGDFPGYLSPGTNSVYINPKGANHAHCHIFRSV